MANIFVAKCTYKGKKYDVKLSSAIIVSEWQEQGEYLRTIVSRERWRQHYDGIWFKDGAIIIHNMGELKAWAKAIRITGDVTAAFLNRK